MNTETVYSDRREAGVVMTSIGGVKKGATSDSKLLRIYYSAGF